MPKISVITPVWCDIPAKVDWLSEMIDSVRAQTFTDWEMILIDDGSPVLVDTVKAKYADDNRLRWFENSRNFGPAMTRNTAVALAHSDCILPVDSDDLLAANDVIERMYQTWIADKTKIIYGNLQRFLPSGPNQFKRSGVIQLASYTFELAMNLEGIMPVTAMHSVNCHKAAGGWKPELNEGLEDVEYWIAAGEQGFCGQKVDYTTLIYRRQETGRAYRLMHVNQNFRAMQLKIKNLHADIYKGVFPMACCGKGATIAPPVQSTPVAANSVAQNVTKITALDGFQASDLVWIAYNGPRTGRFDIVARGPAGLPNKYTVYGTGHYFQIHKAHFGLFSDRQRLGFVVNQPDPRKAPEPEPIVIPVERPAAAPPRSPELSTVIRLDRTAIEANTPTVVKV